MNMLLSMHKKVFSAPQNGCLLMNFERIHIQSDAQLSHLRFRFINAFRLEFFEHIGVCVIRCRDVLVSESVLKHLCRHPRFDASCSIGVAKRMKINLFVFLRLDEIVFYKPLTKDNMRTVGDLQLQGLRKRLKDRQLELEVTDKAKDLIIDSAYDPVYGARPLKRALQSQIEDRLAEEVLNGSIAENMAVRVHAMIDEDGRKKLVFVGTSKKEEPENTEDEPVLT